MSIFIDKIIEAGGSMIPLAICSIVSIAVIIERFVHLRKKNVINDEIVDAACKKIRANDLDGAREIGAQSDIVFGRVLSKGIEVHQIEGTELEEALLETSAREMPRLEKFLNVLSLIGSIAPLLGLFGTVYGMILSFDEIAKESVDKELMAQGISVALITTGAGLVIAIPAIVAFNYFRARVDYFYTIVEEGILQIMRAYHLAGKESAAEQPAKKKTDGQD
ncbi:MotA/TolQ/ExbB proton channel family protein [Cerasicoccus fimbriatus]|uniref:MotA/TolQ/ExbB proton channel family protein n=1 Tax=Cerasicoccus fimbriatus TaxID=3014554 RepID=UPI0022B3958E|nr:MotA/TolQ/ExbB proton channel family protein [Cerasicoccus sp. TK19100]